MNSIDYLRISLIDRCNFQCVYCMPEGADLDYVLREHWLTYDEIVTLLREIFIPLGFNRFRLTGGEPLLRPDVVDLVQAIAQLPETQDLSMTTNAYKLAPLAQDLYDAGLRRINISLDSLQPETFQAIVNTYPQDRASQIYLARCKTFANTPPGPDWEPVTDLSAPKQLTLLPETS